MQGTTSPMTLEQSLSLLPLPFLTISIPSSLWSGCVLRNMRGNVPRSSTIYKLHNPFNLRPIVGHLKAKSCTCLSRGQSPSRRLT